VFTFISHRFERLPRLQLTARRISLLGVALSVACSAGGQTGGEVKDTVAAPTFAATCEDEQVARVELDEQSSLGFTANEARATFGERTELAMQWMVPDPNAPVTYTPDGESELSISLSFNADHANVVTAEPVEECPQKLRVEVTAHLSTTGGALNEVGSGTLSVKSLDEAELEFTIHADELQGTLQPRGEGVQLSALVGHATFGRASVSGNLSLTASSEEPNGLGMVTLIATW
jgi:hypothetical protein